ncbi:ATP-binding protein [Azospirillum soli]|uniref:ATP-binding protein n=1 Tax=Azospirillum soli TaxID=1304799 RepID=UPI001AE653BF|nr:ATP-binding protein [Azospirillum soli]MBP2316936.1 hypothetical protein [Azospirillum soli]
MPLRKTAQGFEEPRLGPRPIIEAVYRDPLVPSYQRNPFTEALPPIEDEETGPFRLAQRPRWDPQHAHLGVRTRMHMIAQIRFVLQPLDMHFDLMDKVSLLLRSGYVNRNPIDPRYFCWLETAIADFKADLALPNLNVTGAGMGSAFIGPSGIGKTTAISAVLNLFPQAVRHSQYKGRPFICTQIPWLHLECPPDGSVKALCLQFFEAVDLLIHSDYCGLYLSKSPAVDNLVVKMARVCAMHGIGLLVIDEIQNLRSAATGSDRKLLNYLVALMNRLRVPILFVGTPKADKVLGQEFRQARRVSSFGDIYWDRLPKGSEFDLLCEALLEYQYLKNPIPNREDGSGRFTAIRDMLYEESQGIAALVSGLVMLAQMRALAMQKETLTPTLIRSVAIDCFRLVRPFLQKLKFDHSTALQYEVDQRIAELNFDQLGDLVFFGQHISRTGRVAVIGPQGADLPPARDAVATAGAETISKEPEGTAQIASEPSAAPRCQSRGMSKTITTRCELVRIAHEATSQRLSPHQGLLAAGVIRNLGDEVERDSAALLS